MGSTFYMSLKEFVEKVIVSRGEQALEELKPLPREGDRGFEFTLMVVGKFKSMSPGWSSTVHACTCMFTYKYCYCTFRCFPYVNGFPCGPQLNCMS